MCFNWATAMKPWRHLFSGRKLNEGMVLQLGHGDEAVETGKAGWKKTTNALLQLGHGDEAVETHAAGLLVQAALVLQLGHGDEAVETLLHRWCTTCFQFASIGPRR